MTEEGIEWGTVTGKGQVTIPKMIRETLGIKYGDKVEFVERDGVVYLRKHFDEEAYNAAIARWSGTVDLGGKTIDEYIEDLRGE